MCAAVLSCMIDDVALVPKLIESRVTISIVQVRLTIRRYFLK